MVEGQGGDETVAPDVDGAAFAFVQLERTGLPVPPAAPRPTLDALSARRRATLQTTPAPPHKPTTPDPLRTLHTYPLAQASVLPYLPARAGTVAAWEIRGAGWRRPSNWRLEGKRAEGGSL